MSGDFTFLKGNIETIILCSLYNGNKYGYEIAKEIKERTDNKYEIKQPTLYAYLKRLEEDDLIVSYWGENSNGGRRRYYALTKTGRTNCEQFISEWEYQRSVLSDLVDGTATPSEITQEEATPLFGRRTPRRSRSNQYRDEIEEQDEIARRLRELTGDTSAQEDEHASELEKNSSQKEVVEQPQPQIIEKIVYVDRPVEVDRQSELEPQPQEEQARDRFEINQDNAEDFMQRFDERAREVSERQSNTEGENYQHVLMNVIGEQLNGMEQSTPDTATTSYYEDKHAALEDVADMLAKEGIRLRIYNHATATYKPKMLIPLAKVLCETSWLTYAVAFIYFGVLAIIAGVTVKVWKPFVITLAVLALVPIGFTIYAILDPTRKNKPKFNFRLAIIVAIVVCVIIILAAVGFSALDSLVFSEFESVAKQILIPTGVAVLIPTFIVIYEVLYKHY